MSKNFQQVNQKIINHTTKASNINQKAFMDFDYSPRKKSKIRSPACLNQSLIYKTPPNINSTKKKYSPSSMINELTDNKNELSSQTYKNEQKSNSKYSPMIIEKPEHEHSSQKNKKINNEIMQNLIQTNLENQFSQYGKISEGLYGIQQMNRVESLQQQQIQYPKMQQSDYQTPTQNYMNKSKQSLSEKSSQKIKNEEDFYMLSDERVSAFLCKNQNNFLYSPNYCSNQNICEQQIYSIINIHSDSNKFINPQSQLQQQSINISNFNKQKVQKFIFNNNQTSTDIYQQEYLQLHKNKQFEQKNIFCSDNFQCTGINHQQQISLDGQVKLTDYKKQINLSQNNFSEQTQSLVKQKIKSTLQVNQEKRINENSLIKDKLTIGTEHNLFKENLKMEKDLSSESFEIENQNVAERLFQMLEKIKIEGTEKDQIKKKENEIAQINIDREQLSRDEYFQRLFEELEDIQNNQQDLGNLINQSTCQVDNVNSQIYQDLNQSFESYISQQESNNKKRSLNNKYFNNGYVINQFCENVNNMVEIKSKFSIQSIKIPQNTLQNSLIRINNQLTEIQNKQQIQENAIYQLIKQMQRHSEHSNKGVYNHQQFSPIQGVAQKLESIQKKQFQCKFCSKTFNKSCSLGGHISRVHKGKSDQYKEKQKIREKRQMERQRKTYFKQKGQQNLAEDNFMPSLQSLEEKRIRKSIKSNEKKFTDSTQMEEESQGQELKKEISFSAKDEHINESIYLQDEDEDIDVDIQEDEDDQLDHQNYHQLEDDEDEDHLISEDQSNIITKKICKEKKKKFVPLNNKKMNIIRVNKALFHSKQYKNIQ